MAAAFRRKRKLSKRGETEEVDALAWTETMGIHTPSYAGAQKTALVESKCVSTHANIAFARL